LDFLSESRALPFSFAFLKKGRFNHNFIVETAFIFYLNYCNLFMQQCID